MTYRDDMIFGDHCGPGQTFPHGKPEVGTLERAKWLMKQLPNGPWQWNGDKDKVYLCTRERGQTFLMGAKRSGMQGSQLTFQYFDDPNDDWTEVEKTPYLKGVMIPGNSGPYISIAPHRKSTIIEIDSPLAQLIKMIPELLEEQRKTEVKP